VVFLHTRAFLAGLEVAYSPLKPVFAGVAGNNFFIFGAKVGFNVILTLF
jgi:hypothetical protein